VAQAPAFAGILDAFFASYYRRRPVSATFVGVHEYDDRLPDYSARGVADAVAEMDGIRIRLRALPPEPLSDAEALDRSLVEGFLEIQQWEHASAHFLHENPCVYTGEAVFGVIGLFLRDFAPVHQRVEAAIARMHAAPGLLAQGRANVRRAPRAWVERAIRECAGARAFFQDGVATLIGDLAITDPRVRAAAERAAGAFLEFQAYLETELMPRTRDGYACGGEAFDLLLRRGHFLDIDAVAVRRMAEARLAECEAALQARAREFGAGSWRDALGQLAERHPAPAEYYARFSQVWDAARGAAVANDLVTWPDYPIRYVPQPAWARTAAPSLYFLAYRSPAPFDRIPVVEYLVPPVDPGAPPDEQRRRLRATNDSVIKLNHVIHHGGLGHHVQNWYAFRAASRVGQIAAVDCASRIAMFCGGTMAEGWACYATDLMDEVGFLTPLERYAQVHARLRMAARALVDVQLHHGAMTLEDAAALYESRVGLSAEAARGEAVKNSMFPATAMMYMVGTDLIHRLRREIAARPGFDLRRFHDRLLAYGSVPVTLAGAAMREAHAVV
jgi:uncharacterized protein (DUF885 family)